MCTGGERCYMLRVPWLLRGWDLYVAPPSFYDLVVPQNWVRGKANGNRDHL